MKMKTFQFQSINFRDLRVFLQTLISGHNGRKNIPYYKEFREKRDPPIRDIWDQFKKANTLYQKNLYIYKTLIREYIFC